MLNKETIPDFRDMQEYLLEQQTERFSFSTTSSFEQLSPEVETVTFSVHLKLAENENFVTLFNQATLKVEKNDEVEQ